MKFSYLKPASLLALSFFVFWCNGNAIEVAFAQPTPAAAPRLLLARGEDGKVTLAFTPVEGAKTYAIKVTDSDGKSELIKNVEVNDYTVHGLKNNRDYRFSVRVMDDKYLSPSSNELVARPVDQPGWETLREAFASSNPTRNSNPFTMVHGEETEAELRTIMMVAYQAGFEGVTLHPYVYKDYLGPGHWDRWKILFDQAKRLGLVIWQQDDYNYPSGYAYGKVVKANPEHGRTTLVNAAKQALVGPKKDFSLDIKPLLKGRDFLVSVSAYPESGGEPVDLTDRVVDGKLTWDVPDGKWELFVIKAIWLPPRHIADSKERMPFVDFMNPKATDAFIETIYQATYDRFGKEFGRTFKGFFTDEAPVSFAMFTPDFLERFEKAKGYSIRKWLPSVMMDKLAPMNKKVRFDYRDFIREETAKVFFGRSRQWCQDHGVQFVGHVIEDHQQDMRRLEELDMPGFDCVFDHWHAPLEDIYWRAPKMTSSVAHYNGSRNDLALVENFAATGWRTGLSEMKRMMDWTTVMGLNQIVPCGLDATWPRAWEVTPDFWLRGKNPQWPSFHEYQVAANRMTMMMRGGRHIAPAIMLDTTESEWAKRGVDMKCPHAAQDELWKSCQAMCEAQVDFDLIPYYVFTDMARTTQNQNKIHIGKEDYRVVVLPPVESIPADVATQLLKFHESGGIVVAIDHVPTASCSGKNDAQVQAAVNAIWSDKANLLGRDLSVITSLEGLQASLTRLGVPDVRVTPRTKSILYCHRQLHGKDLYFFANTGMDPITPKIELRGVRGVPTAWNPVDGKIYQVQNHFSKNDIMEFTLPFGEYESWFVVIESSDEADKYPPLPVRASQPKDSIAVESWQVSNGTDEYHRIFTTEVSLPTDWPSGSPTILNLQDASQILRVKVNGKPVGEKFCSPYQFEVGQHLKTGKNRIEVERVGRFFDKVIVPMVNKLGHDDANTTTPCRKAVLVR